VLGLVVHGGDHRQDRRGEKVLQEVAANRSGSPGEFTDPSFAKHLILSQIELI
jgi:hypothetical protein